MNAMNAQIEPKRIVLEPEKRSAEVLKFETQLCGKIIGQDEAVTQLVNVYQIVAAGMAVPGRPIANLLFLGPTGSGKTRLVEASAEILFGSPDAVIKVDCAEFQHSHEIAKLIGSPPGYLGHRETPPVLTQERLDAFHTDKQKLSLVLFDEIEKASDALWQLLLGILDKATLTLGDNRKVDFSRAIVFMTSNLGASEMGRLTSGGIGFAPRPGPDELADLDRKIYRVALEAAKRKFSPEFMNRIDKAVVFRTLSKAQLGEILGIELDRVQSRILQTEPERIFGFHCTPAAKAFLLKEGTDTKYGARHLKRAIERHLVFPLSSLMSTGQVGAGDSVTVDVAEDEQSLIFTKESYDRFSGGGGSDYSTTGRDPLARVPSSRVFTWRAAGR
ncbi:MAG: ATP-dependent Clp protease ATP-binding subunit [Verrucomicrobia bacterium]|nr:ATP-dependent Clp protease ATP-binding subunit [Verrucomicrobiota bacterium]